MRFARERFALARQQKRFPGEHFALARQQKRFARERFALAREQKRFAREHFAFARQQKRFPGEHFTFACQQKRFAREHLTFARQQKRFPRCDEQASYSDDPSTLRPQPGQARGSACHPQKPHPRPCLMFCERLGRSCDPVPCRFRTDAPSTSVRRG